MPSFRIDRISEEVKKEIDSIIREELHDPRVRGTFSVTHVDITRDMRKAKVFISVLEDELAAALIDALKSAAGFVRRQLGHNLKLRYTPEILFQLDDNIAYGIRMARVIDEVNRQDHERGRAEDD